MKTLLNTPLLAALLLAGTFAGCEKAGPEAAPAKSRTDLLTDKDWKLAAETVSPAYRTEEGELITDVFAYMPECDRDDLMHFERANTCALREGASQCASGPAEFAGTWAFEADDTILRTSLQTLGASSFNVLRLSETTLQLKGIRTIDGVDYTYVYTYAKQ